MLELHLFPKNMSLSGCIKAKHVDVDVCGKCLGGGLVRNTAGSGGGRLGMDCITILILINFVALCPAADCIYTNFSRGGNLDFIYANIWSGRCSWSKWKMAIFEEDLWVTDLFDRFSNFGWGPYWENGDVHRTQLSLLVGLCFCGSDLTNGVHFLNVNLSLP